MIFCWAVIVQRGPFVVANRDPFSPGNTANVLLNVCSVCSTERLFTANVRWMEANAKLWVFAIANKDDGAHRLFFITQKYSISPRLWAIAEEFELISDTCPFAEQWSFSAQTVCCCKQKTKRSLGWTDPRKQNVRCTERSPCAWRKQPKISEWTVRWSAALVAFDY